MMIGVPTFKGLTMRTLSVVHVTWHYLLAIPLTALTPIPTLQPPPSFHGSHLALGGYHKKCVLFVLTNSKPPANNGGHKSCWKLQIPNIKQTLLLASKSGAKRPLSQSYDSLSAQRIRQWVRLRLRGRARIRVKMHVIKCCTPAQNAQRITKQKKNQQKKWQCRKMPKMVKCLSLHLKIATQKFAGVKLKIVEGGWQK